MTQPDEKKFGIELTEQESISTIHFLGTYTPLSVILMKEMINALIRNSRLKMIIKFDHIGALDQSAYEFLEEIHNQVARLSGDVVLICPPDEGKDICDELKKRYHFLMFPDFERARTYFVSREF